MKWISTKDSLPKDCADVLVCGESWNHHIAQIDFFDDNQKGWYKKGGGFLGVVGSMNVTHWMSLPPLPKELSK